LKYTYSHNSLLKEVLKPYIGYIAVATLCTVLLGAVSAAIGTLVGPAVKLLEVGSNETIALSELFGNRIGGFLFGFTGEAQYTAGELLATIPYLLVVLAVIKAVSSLTGWYLWELTGESVSKNLRFALITKYLKFNPSLRKDIEARKMEAQLSSGISTDIKLMREYIVRFYGGFPRELAQIIFLMIVVVILSPKLSAIFFLAILPAAAVASRLGKKLRRRATKALDDYSLLTEWLQQRLLGIETIKHFGTEKTETTKMAVLTTDLFNRFMKAARVKARTSPTLELVAVAFFMVVLGVALYDTYTGKTSGAVQLSFFASLAFLMQSAGKLGRYYNTNREGAAAVDRITAQLNFFHNQQQPNIGLLPERSETVSLELQNISILYTGQKKAAVNDFSYKFEGGKIYCLAGPSGAGKTSIFNMVLGLVTPTSGQIRYNSVDDSTVLYMPQKVQLAPLSVAENVAYPEAPDLDRTKAALIKTNAWEFVSLLEDDQDSLVGEAGRQLSGGQAQRILLARLCYHHSKLVLIDEGTSALDPEMEQSIHAILKNLAAEGAVVITIAHRESAAAMADVVVKIADGNLIN